MNITNEQLSDLVLQLGRPMDGCPTSFRPVRQTFPMPQAPVAVVETSGAGSASGTAGTATGVNPSGTGGIPKQLLSIQAIQTPVNEQTYTACNITVSWTYDTADKDYAGIKVWFLGYHGSKYAQLMTSGVKAPINFICDATKETVGVYGQTMSSTGLTAPLSFAAHTTVTLSGVVGPPPAPVISQSLIGTSTGYQFGFYQVLLPINDIEIISVYKVYRGTLNDPLTATLLQTITPVKGDTSAITVTDTIMTASGYDYYYWVSAMNTAGFESTLTAAQSGSVQGSVGSVPPTLNTPFKITTSTSTVNISTSPSCFFTRSDKTKTIIGQTSLTSTGLPSGNTVYVFPYWRESDQSLQFVLDTDVAIPSITGISMTAASSQYIKTASGSNIPEVFSIEMWVKASATGALFDFSAPLTGGTTTASVCQCVITAAGEIQFSIYNGTTWASAVTTGASMLDTTWHHVICAYDGVSTGSIYVDGIVTSDATVYWMNMKMGVADTAVGYWHFGFVGGKLGAPITTNLYNTSVMSHIALYHEALNGIHAGSHVQALANLGESYYAEELTYDAAINLWKLNETSGATAADSIDSNAGTYVGTPTLNQVSPVITVLGTPTICWPYNALLAIQVQNLRHHTPLANGGLVATTASITIPSAITSTGGSGGGYNGQGGRGGGSSGGSIYGPPPGYPGYRG